MIKEKILKEKGISLISLSIAVMIILIITGTIIYNVRDNLKVERLEQMQQDIENLRDKIDTYYVQYGDIPIKEAEYTNITDMQKSGIISQAVDTGKFYVIDLEAIENLTLSFGQDYETVKTLTDSTQISAYTNLYIINEHSHNIFYPKGIEIDGEMFYTNYTAEDIDTEEVILINTDEIKDNWSPIYDVNGKYVDENGDEAVIPAGFKVSRTEGMDKINDGLVIQDEEGNEFVWVPVNENNSFMRREGYAYGSQQSITNYGEADSTGTNSKLTETEETQLEAKRIYASVEKNGGFYIGRYEAGKDSEGNVVCKKGVNTYNNIVGWNNDTVNNNMTIETGGAVELARNFAEENEYDTNKVQSTLCYGVQWDTALNFIDLGYNGYAQDSSKMGWYSDNWNSTTSGNTESNPNLVAGKDLIYNNNPTVIANKHKNIYDMAGNVWEWTMESYKNNERVSRGGACTLSSEVMPASARYHDVSSYKNSIVGFRIALYINNINEEDLPETPDTDNKQVEVGKIVTGENKDYTTEDGTAKIPVGFMIVPGCEDISEGLVISDDPDDTEKDANNIVAKGNQFVWIPVDKNNFAKEFVRREGKYISSGEEKTQSITDYGEADKTGANTNTSIKETPETQAEAKAMYQSVLDNGGFYIGRYEAGTTATSGTGIRGEVVSKKGANVYNNIEWGNGMTNETEGAVQVARNFAEQNNYDTTQVHSTLCYGVQWDTALNFIDPGYTGYAKDSTGKGWYSDNYNSTSTDIKENNPNQITGKDLVYTANPTVISNKHKNIYDMAGNVYEWTMEAYDTTNRALRGGSYFVNTGSNSPASYRLSLHPSNAISFLSFRLALYL